jgi:uncharacterized protein
VPEIIIDSDVHPLAPNGLAAVYPYLPAGWSKRLASLEGIDGTENGKRTAQRGLQLARGRIPWPSRKDAIPPSGGAPGSDREYLRQHYLDRHHVDIAVLLPIQPAKVDAFTNPDEAAMFVRGMNDYVADQWLPFDSRFRMAMVVSPHDPAGAAAEVRRFGSTPGAVAVWIPLINVLLGKPYYYPIYEAAEELGLAILCHPNGQEGDWQGSTGFAGGTPSNYVEKYSLYHEVAASNVVNLVFSGTLERFKKLRWIFVEYGWTWVPAQLWRMDAAWKAGRHSVPWATKSPTDYVRERIRFTTEPALEVPNDAEMEHVLKAMHAEETLMFSSDYPHWDSDEPEFVFRHLQPELKRRIFAENAIETFGQRLQVKVPA